MLSMLHNNLSMTSGLAVVWRLITTTRQASILTKVSIVGLDTKDGTNALHAAISISKIFRTKEVLEL
jgi:hypothetical protein